MKCTPPPGGYSFFARLLHVGYTLKHCLILLVDYFVVVEGGDTLLQARLAWKGVHHEVGGLHFVLCRTLLYLLKSMILS